MGLLTSTVPRGENSTENISVFSESTTLPKIYPIIEGSFYVLIPLFVLLLVLITLSLLVYSMASNRRRLVYMYCKRTGDGCVPYEDSEYDSPLEKDSSVVDEDEYEMGNEDNPTKSLLKGKLQLNNRYENYLSTSQLNRTSELFT